MEKNGLAQRRKDAEAREFRMNSEKILDVARGEAPKSKIARNEVPKQPPKLNGILSTRDCFVAGAPRNNP